MNARSALETIGAILLGSVFGFVICWFYLASSAKTEANTSLAAELASFQKAAPEIALQVESLQRTAQRTGALNATFATYKPLLESLADCPVPDELHSLSIQRTEAINANARGSDGGAVEVDLPQGAEHRPDAAMRARAGSGSTELFR